MKWLRLLHRYVGLTIAIFIVLVSVTGSLLAFYPELERATSPDWFVAPQPGVPMLSLPALTQAAERHDPRAAAVSVQIDELGRAIVGVIGRPDSHGGAGQLGTVTLNYSQMVLNPYTGELLGTRHRGAISEGLHNLMPFILEFHYGLLAGVPGDWLLGIVALIWFVDCFTGFVITLPRAHAGSKKSWLSRWKKAWQIKAGASFGRLNFDIHRAFSLWLWLALAVFAWSSFYMNLWDTLYTKLTRPLMAFHPPWHELIDRADSAPLPPHSFAEMFEHADRQMRQLAAEEGFDYRRPMRMSYHPEYGAYRLAAHSSLDLSERLARTDIYLDANTHELLLRYYPRSQYTGNTVANWLYALHTARVWGWPYRIFVCLLGIALVTITVSGVLIWLRRRRVT